MKILLLISLASFVLSLILGFLIIPLLKKLKVGQPILKYVSEHKTKGGFGLNFSARAGAFSFTFFRAGGVSCDCPFAPTMYVFLGFIKDVVDYERGTHRKR